MSIKQYVLDWFASIRPHAVEAAAGAPPVTVAGMTVLGYPLSDWVQLLAGLWLVMQMAYFVWAKFIRKRKE